MDWLKDRNFFHRVLFRKSVVAAFDFVLLAFAVYLGYALRLGTVIPRYVTSWRGVIILFPSVCVVAFAVLGQYATIWRHAGLEDYVRFIWSYIVGFFAFLLVNLCGLFRASWRTMKTFPFHHKSHSQPTLIVGAGDAGALLARDLLHNDTELYPVGFIDDDEQKLGRQVSGVKVLGKTSNLREIVQRRNIQVVLIAIPAVNGAKRREIYDILSPLNVEVRILPSMRELAGGKVSVSGLRQVKLEDLLGREPVRIDIEASMNYVKGKRVLITGAGGSIGSEIVRQVIHNNPAEVFVLGHGEQSIYLLTEELSKMSIDVPVQPIIADVADEIAIENLFASR